MDALKARKPTYKKLIHDALLKLGEASNEEIAELTGIPLKAIKPAMSAYRREGSVIWASRAPKYKLADGAKPPTDLRGRKRV